MEILLEGEKMQIVEVIFICIAVIIWIALCYNLVLIYFGYKYFLEINAQKDTYLDNMIYFPNITILIPGHNEEKVIGETLEGISKVAYPKEKMKVIFINDNSDDKSGEVFKKFKNSGNYENFFMLETTKEAGGKGKSGALNYGLRYVETDYLLVYDADCIPETNAVKILVKTIVEGNYGAVIGKFRARNKSKNILTKMINIEGISFQWLAQGGRGKLMNLSTIPGTNYIINIKDLKNVGGFDPQALAEDTEISIKLYRMGKKIKFMPLAVAWEQEPETLKVFIKQRTRWIEGNLYVLFKYWKTNPFDSKNRYFIDILSYFLIYILFLFSVLGSHSVMLGNIIFNKKLNIEGNINAIWFLSFVLYLISVSITLSFEKGELNRKSFVIIALSYFTYSQLWLFISVRALFKYIKERVLKKEITWYKTERF